MLHIPFIIIGFVGSLYLLFVHYGHKSICDINDSISCTKAVTSAYGTLFLIPTPYFGLLYFLVLGLFWEQLQYIVVPIGIAYAVYMVWAQYKLNTICIICNIVHAMSVVLIFL